MSRYTPQLLDHFRHPRNVGLIEGADGEASVANPQCGDTTRLTLRVRHGVIAEARWQTRGCATAIAASSAASELVTGRTLDEARALTRHTIAEALGGLQPSKMHGSVLAVDALRAALADYEARRSSRRAQAAP